MNIRKSIDYSSLYVEISKAIATDLSRMELYLKLGRLVSNRPEKGTAVIAAEYITANYPECTGFSPRNLRRMRDFYRMYEGYPEILEQTMKIGWTQNTVIMESDLNMEDRYWYIQATYQFGWSKMELSSKICEHAHESTSLDSTTNPCYSSNIEGDGDGKKETLGTFPQNLQNADVQRELQWQGSCYVYLQSPCPFLNGIASRIDDTSSLRKPVASPPDRKRDNMAEKPDLRFPARSDVLSLNDLCRVIFSFGTKSKKARTVHLNAEVEHQWKGLRPLWRPGVYQKDLSSRPNTANHRPHTSG